MIRRISNKRAENRNSIRRNIRNRRFESVEDGWMRSIDDFYGLDFMDGDDHGYYSPKGTPQDSYASVECFIDDVDGSFGVLLEDVEVDGIVDSFFDTMHFDRDPLRRKSLSEFTDEDVQEFVENCINSGEFSHTESEAEVLWTERDGYSWAYDDMIASLDARAREQEQKLLDAEWDACRLIKDELSMATEARNRRNHRASCRLNERRSRRFEATAKTIKPKKNKPSGSYRWMTLRDYKTGSTLGYVDLDDYGSVEVSHGSTPRGKDALLLTDRNTGKIVAYVDIDGMPTVEYDFN